MKAFIAIMLIAATALAGCATEDAEPACTVDCDEAPGVTGNQTAPPVNGINETVPNNPPVGNLTFPALTAIAGQPANFTITISDDDGDNMTWYFDADGDGNSDLNGTQDGMAVFTYDFEGSYNATLNVTDGQAFHLSALQVVVSAPAATADPNAPEDRGWYIFDPVTKVCQVKTYTTYGGTIYTSALGGGTWVIGESNGMAGLQIADDHPTSGTGAGFEVAGAEDCEDGDLILI